MSNPPPGPRAKVERAKKHLNDLTRQIREFHETNPYAIVREADPKGGWVARVVPWPPPIPSALPLIFGDLIHNLRAALDILICDLVIDNYPQHLGDWSGFPIVRNAKALPSEVARKVKGASNAVQQAVIRHKPYEGGNGALWRLHRLDILDKHRLILTTIANNESVNIGPIMTASIREAAAKAGMAEPPGIADIWIRPANPCDDEGGVIFRDQVNPEPNYELQFKMHISVHEPGLVECEPIIPFATQLVQVIESTVAGFDVYFK